MEGLGNALGGFLQGFGQARMAKDERAVKKQESDLAKKLAEINILKGKAELSETQMRQAYLDRILKRAENAQMNQAVPQPMEQPNQKGPVFSDSFKQKTGGDDLTDTLAGMDMYGLEALKEVTGIDFPRAASEMETRRKNKADESFKERDADLAERRLRFDALKWKKEREDINYQKATVDGVDILIPFTATGQPAGNPIKLGSTEAQKKLDGAKNKVSTDVNALYENYIALDNMRAIVSTDRNPVENALASLGASGPGQWLESKIGTEAQSLRAQVKQLTPSVLLGIKNAESLGAVAMNSEKELAFYTQMITKETNDIKSVVAALAVIDEKYGDGQLMKKIRKSGRKDFISVLDKIQTQGEEIRNADLVENPFKGMSDEDVLKAGGL